MVNIGKMILEYHGNQAKKAHPAVDDPRSLHELATLVSENPLDMEELENIDEYPYVKELGYCLPFIGLRNIEELLGKEALLFVVQEWDCEHSFDRRARAIKEQCQDHSLIDFGQLRLAQTAWKFNPNRFSDRKSNRRYVRGNYLTLDKIREFEVPSTRLSEILIDNARDSTPLSEERLRDYEVEVAIPGVVYGRHPKWGWINEDTRINHNVFVDGLFGEMLMHRGEPNAIVSFSIDDPQTLKITQIQGINPYLLAGIDPETIPDEEIPRQSPKGLYAIKFRDVLLELGKDTARFLGMSRLGIQSGHNNNWTRVHYGDGKIHLPLESALVVYDGFAEDHGFNQDPETKDWYLPLD